MCLKGVPLLCVQQHRAVDLKEITLHRALDFDEGDRHAAQAISGALKSSPKRPLLHGLTSGEIVPLSLTGHRVGKAGAEVIVSLHVLDQSLDNTS